MLGVQAQGMLAGEHPECLHSHFLRSTHPASQRYLTADVGKKYGSIPTSGFSSNYTQSKTKATLTDMKQNDKLLLLHDSGSLVGSTNQPMQVWVNPNDILRIDVICQRTPTAHVVLRSRPDRPVVISGDHARTLIGSLPNLKGALK